MKLPSSEVVEFTHDNIGRARLIEFESSNVEEVAYLGLGRVIARSLGGGEATSVNTLDRFGRIVELLWKQDDDDPIDNSKYGYDRNSNMLYRTNVLEPILSDLYHESGESEGYDLLNQVTFYARGTLTDSGTDSIPDTLDTPLLQVIYERDGVGNVNDIGKKIDDEEEFTVTERAHDRQNRLTTHDKSLTCDAVGNLTIDDLGNTYTYDAWNRLIAFNKETDRYGYDALNRRIKEGNRTFIQSLDGNIVEEADSGTPTYQYVWSADGSSMTLRYDFTDILYAITDINGNVTTITDVDGTVMERYVYDLQGNFVVAGPSFVLKTAEETTESDFGWVHTWGGGRWDATTGQSHRNGFSQNVRLNIVVGDNIVSFRDGNGNTITGKVIGTETTTFTQAGSYIYFANGQCLQQHTIDTYELVIETIQVMELRKNQAKADRLVAIATRLAAIDQELITAQNRLTDAKTEKKKLKVLEKIFTGLVIAAGIASFFPIPNPWTILAALLTADLGIALVAIQLRIDQLDSLIDSLSDEISDLKEERTTLKAERDALLREPDFILVPTGEVTTRKTLRLKNRIPNGPPTPCENVGQPPIRR